MDDERLNLDLDKPHHSPTRDELLLRGLLAGGSLLGLAALLAQQRLLTQSPSKWASGRLSRVEPPATRFKDVVGVDEAKAELAEVVAFLKHSGEFARMGARLPRGVLLIGAPGTGKTLLARAVAGEAGVPFFSASGSEFVQVYVGVGAARVRTLFERATRAAPSIVFIDEIDAVGGARGRLNGNEEREQTLNQILVELDGFSSRSSPVVVIAATNRADTLDPALLRPGRFDRRISIHLPDVAGRRAVLGLYAEKVALSADINLDVVARRTGGMSPADLSNLVNEAAILAARRAISEREAGRSATGVRVSNADLDEAFLKVIAGPELRSRVLPPDIRRRVAYHEAGHAVVMRSCPGCGEVSLVQILPRGDALGLTLAPQEDLYMLTRNDLADRLAGLMGGRVAEEIFFGEVTSGAQADIAQANALARRMVTELGMSTGGPADYVALGDTPSPERASRTDNAVAALLSEALAQARALVQERRSAVQVVAERLLEVETIDGETLDALIAAALAA